MTRPYEAIGSAVRCGDSVVHYRMGRWTDAGQRHDLARQWVRDLVDANALFSWPGLATTVPGTKPTFDGSSAADFSISHSGDLLLVAVCADGAVGADVEAGPFETFDHVPLMRRMCTPAELAFALTLTPEQRRGYLADVWTAKESRVKCSGLGLADDFRGFDADPATRVLQHPTHFRAWVTLRDNGGHLHAHRLTCPPGQTRQGPI